MATTYCSAADVSDFLRIPITATSTPNTAQVEKIINRKEVELEDALECAGFKNVQPFWRNHMFVGAIAIK